ILRYVHEQGFSIGLYSPTANCIGTPGSQGFEDQDAQTYAAWNADYLKYRICSPAAQAQALFETMGQALAKTGRAIVYSVASPPFSDWMADTGQLWRTGPSIVATWDGILR